MIKSMTGYGRHREVIDGRDILCEVKSVNSRYLDTNIKLGRMYNALEDKVKQYAMTRVSRGKLDIYISIENIQGDDNGLSVNEKFLESYVNLLRDIKERYELAGEVSIHTVAGRNEVFVTTRPDEDTEAAGKALLVLNVNPRRKTNFFGIIESRSIIHLSFLFTLKEVPRCSNISAHVRYSPKALANLSVADFICCKSERT